VRVDIHSDVKFGKARVIDAETGEEIWRFDNVNRRSALPPGNYIVEIDDSKIPLKAAEGELLNVKPQ
jgi:hypothetical protein